MVGGIKGWMDGWWDGRLVGFHSFETSTGPKLRDLFIMAPATN